MVLICLGGAVLMLVQALRPPIVLSDFAPSTQPTASPAAMATPQRSFNLLTALQSTLVGAKQKIHRRMALQKSDVELVVDLSDRQVHLYKAKQHKASYTIAVGQKGWETPTGSFKIIHMQQNPSWHHPITGQTIPPGSNNPLGARWIGFWTDHQLEIGFHGTNQEDLLGQAVSHGCLRMRNQDIIDLYPQVTEGTLVIVKP